MESSGEQLHRFTGMDWCFWRYKVPEHDTRCVYVVGRYPWESFGTLMAFCFPFLFFLSFSSCSLSHLFPARHIVVCSIAPLVTMVLRAKEPVGLGLVQLF